MSGVRGEAVSWARVDGVLEVTLHRAPCNELGTTALAELEQLVPLLRAPDFSAVLLYSSLDSGFCAGADLRELYAGLTTRTPPDWVQALPSRRARRWVGQALGQAEAPLIRREVRSFLDRIHAVFDAIDQAPVTTVAALHRVVFGGGLELALTADIRVADPGTRLCLPELRLGIIPGFGAIPRLRRDAPNATLRDLLLTGRSLGARRAYELGLVQHLSGPGQAVTLARGIARQAARFPPAAVRAAKSLAKPLPVDELTREKELFCQLVTSRETREALARFVSDTSARPYLP